jgi:hypothetical protein
VHLESKRTLPAGHTLPKRVLLPLHHATWVLTAPRDGGCGLSDRACAPALTAPEAGVKAAALILFRVFAILNCFSGASCSVQA